MSRLAMLLALSLGLAACAADDPSADPDPTSTLTIENDSSYTFIEINLSPIDQTSWGSDLLGSDVLEPGELLELSRIECDVYDIRIIDEEGDTCVLDTVDLCLDNAVWRIDDGELASCSF